MTRPNESAPRSAARRRLSWVLPAVVALVGIGATVAVSRALRRSDARALHTEFRLESEERRLAIEAELDNAADLLQSVALLYAASEHVTREEFRLFTTPMLAQHAFIQALEWIPRIPAAERGTHEAAARADGLDTYSITERQAQGA